MNEATPDPLSTVPYLRWAKFESGAGDIPLTASAVPPITFEELGLDPATLELCTYSTYGDPAILRGVAEGWGRSEENVLLASSTTHAHFCFAASHVEPGGVVLAESPGYTCLADSISCMRVNVVPFVRRFEDGYALPTDEIESLVAEHAPSLLLVSHLHNPSGVALTDEEGAFLADLCERTGVVVLCDEIYRPFLDPDPGPLALRHPAIVSLWGLNKAYGIPQIRVGWGLAAPERVERARRIVDSTTAHNSCLSDQVAAFAVPRLSTLAERAQGIARDGWHALGRRLPELGFELVEPAGGVIGFPRHPWGGDLLRERLLAAGVGVTPGRFFGAPDHVRIGWARPVAELEDAFARMQTCLEEGANA